VNLNRQWAVLHHGHAVGLALTGRLEEARQAARKGGELAPDFRIGPRLGFLRGPVFNRNPQLVRMLRFPAGADHAPGAWVQ
jgi:hypothetical protein